VETDVALKARRMNPPPTALIAEDEPLLAAALQAELARAWPELRVLATVGDGLSAVKQAMALAPDVLFFDIRMPGLSGLEAAAELADQWPPPDAPDRPFRRWCLSPPTTNTRCRPSRRRPWTTCSSLCRPPDCRKLWKNSRKPARIGQFQLSKLKHPWSPCLRACAACWRPKAARAAPRLSVIAASLPGALGASIRMVPMEEVLYFEAADKYLRVLTAGAEYLIRTPLKELIAQLDPQVFWQIHRGTVVRASLIDTVTRDEAGKLSLSLRGRPERLAVSRLYAHLFRAM
jgi:DNA-binding LytR/AlgR family response regulator